MTREEALAAGLAYVDQASAGIPSRRGMTAAERAYLGMAAATFLLGDDSTAPTGDTHEPVGDGAILQCEVAPGDHLFVRGAKVTAGADGRPMVGFEARTASGEVMQVLASPARARAWAAAVLNAADNADGTDPLNFVSGGVQ